MAVTQICYIKKLRFMLHIHRLADLNEKLADMESTLVIRDLKKRIKFPISAMHLEESLIDYLVSESEIAVMQESLKFVEPTLDTVRGLKTRQNGIYEVTNLQRAAQLIKSVHLPLFNNICYSKSISEWQAKAIEELTLLLNQIPHMKTTEDKVRVNDSLNRIFKKILRNDKFSFNPEGIISEGQVMSLEGLSGSLAKGFLFHTSIEEELKKLPFSKIKERIPPSELAEVQKIEANVLEVRKGVEKAYNINMRMVNCAVVLYAYIKMLRERL